ncbi:MAG: RidA family protein [Acidobacteriota bacterium]
MIIEKKIVELGLILPAEFKNPTGKAYPFSWVRVRGNHAYISGHLPLNEDGSLAEPIGKVGSDLSLEEGKQAARLVALSMLSSLKRELGDLDRVSAWLRALGMVNIAPGFKQIPAIVNGFSELIVEVYGPERGLHSRAAVGMAELPFGVAVEVEAEVEIS